MTLHSFLPMFDEQSQDILTERGTLTESTATLDLAPSTAPDSSDPFDSFQSSEQLPIDKRLSWRMRSTIAAFVVGALPVLIAGTAVHGFGNRLLPKLEAAGQETVATQAFLSHTLARQRHGLAGLSFGTGVLALVAGATASAIAWKRLEPVERIAQTTRATAKRLELDEDREYDENEVRQLQADATVLANRLPELLWQQQTRAEQQAAIAAIEHRLRQASSTDEILDVTVKTVRQLLEADRATVFCLKDDGEGTFVAESVASGYPKTLRATVRDPCFNEGYVDRYRRGRIVAIHNIHNAGLSDCYIGLLERFAVKSLLIGPLMQGDRLYGLLIVHQCDNPRYWDATEIDLMGQICARVGLALSFADHLHVAERAAARKQCLADFPRQLHGVRDEHEMLARAAAILQKALAVESVAAIAIEERGASCTSRVAGKPLGTSEGMPFSAAELETLRAGQPLMRSQLLAEFETEKTADAASLAVPVLNDGDLIGILHCQHPTERDWSTVDVEIAEGIAVQMGCALNAVKAFHVSQRELQVSTTAAERERERAERLQQRWSALFGDGEALPSMDLQTRSKHIDRLQRQLLDLMRTSRVALTLPQAMSPSHSANTEMAAEQLQSVSSTAQSLATAIQGAEHYRYRVGQTLDNSRDALELVTATFEMARDMSISATQQLETLERYAATISTIAAQMTHFVEQMELYAVSSQQSALDAVGTSQHDPLAIAQQVTTTTRRLVASASELTPVLDKLRSEAGKTSNVVSNTNQQILSGTHLMSGLQGNFNQLGEANIRMQTVLGDAIAIATEQVQTANAASQAVLAIAQKSDMDRAEPFFDVTDKLAKLAALSQDIQTGLEQLRMLPPSGVESLNGEPASSDVLS